MTNRIALKYGILGGIGALVLNLSFYLINRENYFSKLLFWSNFFLIVVCMIRAVHETRNALPDNQIQYKDALKCSFLVFVVGFAIIILYNILMQGIVDPGLLDLEWVKQKQDLNSLRGFLNENEIEKAMDILEENQPKFRLYQYFISYSFWLIPGFIASLIIARVMRSENIV